MKGAILELGTDHFLGFTAMTAVNRSQYAVLGFQMTVLAVPHSAYR
jgi:hypothetical protein